MFIFDILYLLIGGQFLDRVDGIIESKVEACVINRHIFKDWVAQIRSNYQTVWSDEHDFVRNAAEISVICGFVYYFECLFIFFVVDEIRPNIFKNSLQKFIAKKIEETNILKKEEFGLKKINQIKIKCLMIEGNKIYKILDLSDKSKKMLLEELS